MCTVPAILWQYYDTKWDKGRIFFCYYQNWHDHSADIRPSKYRKNLPGASMLSFLSGANLLLPFSHPKRFKKRQTYIFVIGISVIFLIREREFLFISKAWALTKILFLPVFLKCLSCDSPTEHRQYLPGSRLVIYAFICWRIIFPKGHWLSK